MYNTGLCSVAFYHTISKWPQRYRTLSNRKYNTFSQRLGFCLFVHAVSAILEPFNSLIFFSTITIRSINAMHTYAYFQRWRISPKEKLHLKLTGGFCFLAPWGYCVLRCNSYNNFHEQTAACVQGYGGMLEVDLGDPVCPLPL